MAGNSTLRLNQKHSRNLAKPTAVADGAALVAAQSFAAAALGAFVAALLLNFTWMLSASALDRVLPWLVIVQGLILGLVVRRWGNGLDWRFPLLAAFVAILAAYSGNFLLAADTAAAEFGVGPLQIITSMSEWTLGVYFEEVVGAGDHIYAFCAAAVAAFYAKKRLTRAEEFALRNHQQDKAKP